MTEHTPPTFKRFLLVPLLVALGWTMLMIVGIGLLGTNPAPLASLGQFGDMFGSFNAAMTAFAMCAAIYAASLQNWQVQEAKRQFAVQIEMQNEEIQQTKNQFAEERKGELEGLRTQKLEVVLERLDKLRELTGTVPKEYVSYADSKFTSFALDTALLLLPAYSRAEIIVKLYFPENLNDLLPVDALNSVIRATQKELNEGQTEALLKRGLSEAIASLGNEAARGINFGVKFADHLIRRQAIDRNFLKQPEREKGASHYVHL